MDRGFLTFDCYGTLIDWEQGIVSAFRSEPAQKGSSFTDTELLETYHEVEALIEAEVWRPYREVLDETAGQVAARLPGFVAGRPHFLSDSLPSWKPFADTNGALEALRALGFRLAILSNTDDDLLEATCRHFSVPFDFVITARQVRSYKPAEGHFLAARERIGAAPWIHVAQSWYHDITPAARHGIRSAWINRTGEPRGQKGTPLCETNDLAEFAGIVTGL